MFRTSVKLDSKIFKSAERRRALSVVVSKNARDFRESTKRKMIESNPTGKVYERGRGAGFKRRHRASRRGERPAVEEGKLIRSITSQATSELSAKVEVGASHAEILVGKLGREIFTRDDLREAEIKLAREANQKIQSLL